MKHLLLIIAILLCISHISSCSLKVQSYIGNNMVIKENDRFCIYGNASIGNHVRVGLLNRVYISQVKDKEFNVCFSTTWNTLDPFTISIVEYLNSTIIDTLEYHNIVFGYVILCSGQSNMQLGMRYIFNATAEIEEGNYSMIRLSSVKLNYSSTEQNYLQYMTPDAWNEVTPTFLRGNSVPIGDYFSALCYLSIRSMYKRLPKPAYIGGISSSYTGTPIRAWMSPDALSKCPPAIPSASDLTQPHKQLSVLWNSMLHPLIGIKLSAFLWSQGEADITQTVYACQFKAFIMDIKSKFGTCLPFIFVNGISFPRSGVTPTFANLRLMQNEALELNDVYIVNRNHLGDPQQDLNSTQLINYLSVRGIHPRNIQPVADDSADVLLSILDILNMNYKYPQLDSTKISLSIKNARRLYLNGSANCTLCCGSGYSNVFDIQVGSIWIPVHYFSINKNTIEIPVPIGSYISGIRYAYADYPQCILFNEYGKALLPF